MTNALSFSRTPWNQLPIALVYRSLDRKLYRDQYCIECGHPFMSISDKYVSVIDGNLPIDKLRTEQRIIEARCRHSRCQQYFRVEV